MTLPVNLINPDLHWRIYYHDPEAEDYFSTYSNQDGEPDDAPVYGVICIVQPMSGGRWRDVVVQGDYYAVDEEGKWIGMDDNGIADRDANNIPYSALKEGRWINTDRFNEIYSRAFNDVDFGGLGRPVLVDRPGL
jgi:hypothetical protein